MYMHARAYLYTISAGAHVPQLRMNVYICMYIHLRKITCMHVYIYMLIVRVQKTWTTYIYI